MHHRNALVFLALLATSASKLVNAAGLKNNKQKNAREDLSIRQDTDNEASQQLLANQSRRLGRRSLKHERPTAAPTALVLSEDGWTGNKNNNPPPDSSQESGGEHRATPSTGTVGKLLDTMLKSPGGAVGGCQNCVRNFPDFRLETAHLCKAACYQHAQTPTGGDNQLPSSAASNGNNDGYRDPITGVDHSMCGCVQVFTSPNNVCPEHCFQTNPSGNLAYKDCRKCIELYPERKANMCPQFCYGDLRYDPVSAPHPNNSNYHPDPSPPYTVAQANEGAVGGCENCIKQFPNFRPETAHLCKAACYQYP